jgi:LCP family protein required for cell wall assembly
MRQPSTQSITRFLIVGAALVSAFLLLVAGFHARTTQADSAGGVRLMTTLLPTVTPAGPTKTPSITPTATITPLPSPTATASPTITVSPTITPSPSYTPPPTNTPRPATSTPWPEGIPTFTPSPTYVFEGTYLPPSQPPVFTLPPPAPLIDVDNDALVNILLLGSDSPDNYYRRTDVIVLVSINTVAKTVAMWRIPREMFVYVPGYSMDLINAAFARGAMMNYPGGSFGMMKDVFRYNFGIEVDHYARVNYPGFEWIIQKLGGLELSVDCGIQDWRIKSPELDPTNPDNWEIYTLPVGHYRLHPDTALWYVRSRKTTSEIDRGRRQMDVLRAIWQQVRAMGLLSQAQELWPVLTQVVDTDMSFTDVLPLIPLAATLDVTRVARYSGSDNEQWIRTYTPDDGREVLLPIRENLLPMLQEFLTPPTANRLGRAAVRIDVIDGSWYGIGLERVAADRLAWEGFVARPLDGITEIKREGTLIYDYTGQTKGSPLPYLQEILRVDDANIIRQPDPNRTVDFRVEIGMAYNSCIYTNAEDDPASQAPDGTTLDNLPSAVCWLQFRAGVNVRSGPGLDYEVVDMALPDDHFPVVGRNDARTWWQINDNGEIAWISAETGNVVVLGQCESVPVAQ